MLTSSTLATAQHRPLARRAAPRSKLQFRGHSRPVTSTGTYIIETDTNSNTGSDDDEYTAELYDMFEKSSRPRSTRSLGCASLPASHDGHFVCFPASPITSPRTT